MQRAAASAASVGKLSVFLHRMTSKARQHHHPAEDQRPAQDLPDQLRVSDRIFHRHPEAVDPDHEAAPGDRSRSPEFLCEIVAEHHVLKACQV